MIKAVELKRSKIEVKGKELKVRLKGLNSPREDIAFLNNLFTNDIQNLKPFHFNYNLMLKQNGTPIEEFFVFNMGDRFLLDADCEASKIIDYFERVKLSLQVYFKDLSNEYQHFFVWGEEAGKWIEKTFGEVPEEGAFILKEDTIVANNRIRLKEEGFDIIGINAKNFLKDVDMASTEEFEDMRIKRGVPAIHKELKEGFSPLEAGLEKYAISFTKGCYVGQEAIARVHYKGRLPRRLVILRTVGDVKEGDSILKDGEKVGVVTSVSPKSPIAMGYINTKVLDGNIEYETPKGRLFLL